MRLVFLCAAAMLAASAAPLAEDRPPPAGPSDAEALTELLGTRDTTVVPWSTAPELVVLMSVMQFESNAQHAYIATADSLTRDEAEGLAADLSEALAVLTGGAFIRFAAIHFEDVPAGTMSRVMRSGQIVVGRYRDVKRKLDAVGYGGRTRTAAGRILSGTILLDEGYDRLSTRRSLVRAHELGHALGYNHLSSRRSIMNPQVGSEPTSFDRHAAAIAFAGARPAP